LIILIAADYEMLKCRNFATRYLPGGKRACLAIAVFSAMSMASSLAFAGAAEISALLKLREKDIDVAHAALVLAKEIYPDLNVAAYSRKVDQLADDVRHHGNGIDDPDGRIRVLNTVLYQSAGFRYDHSVEALDKLENHTLNGVLDTKTGTCVTLPLLYLAVAQRLGFPVYAVAAPNHYFLRYVDKRLAQQNIEATSGGGFSPDSEYIREMHVSERGIRHGGFMRTLTHRQFLALLVGDISIALYRKFGNIDQSIQYLEMVAPMYPAYPDTYFALGQAYTIKSRQVDSDSAEQYQKRAAQYFKRAMSLGYVAHTPLVLQSN
jgi:tetratricopeptide (TPR) repeat protein